jgi:hypothetical protein
MVPTAMQERQSENANKPLDSLWDKSVTVEVNAQRHFDNHHSPHQGHYDGGDDEAAEKFPLILFCVHGCADSKSYSAANFGNFVRVRTKKRPRWRAFSV